MKSHKGFMNGKHSDQAHTLPNPMPASHNHRKKALQMLNHRERAYHPPIRRGDYVSVSLNAKPAKLASILCSSRTFAMKIKCFFIRRIGKHSLSLDVIIRQSFKLQVVQRFKFQPFYLLTNNLEIQRNRVLQRFIIQKYGEPDAQMRG